MEISLTAWWLIALFCALGLEMLLSTIYLLCFALGFAACAACAYFDCSLAVQLSCGGVIIILGSFLAHVFRVRRLKNQDSLNSLDQGNVVNVQEVLPDGSAKINYRGAVWHARASDLKPLQAGPHVIEKIKGNVLMIKRIEN